MSKTRIRGKKHTKQAGLGTGMFLVVIGLLVAAIGMRLGGTLPFHSGWGIVAAGAITAFIGMCMAFDTPSEDEEESGENNNGTKI